MDDQLILKLNKTRTLKIEDRFNELSKDDQDALLDKVRSFCEIDISRQFLIYLQRKAFLNSDDPKVLLTYLLKCKEAFKFKFENMLSELQQNIVVGYVDNLIEEHGTSYVVDNHIIPYERLNYILLKKYITKDALRKRKVELWNKFTTKSCLEKFGTKRVSNPDCTSAEHMKMMNNKSLEWRDNLTETEKSHYSQLFAEITRKANANRTNADWIRINEKNRQSNIRTWQNKSEEEKERIRKQNATNSLLGINHIKMSPNSSKNTKFKSEFLDSLGVPIYPEFPIQYEDSHLFKYDFKVGNKVLIDINPVETHNSSIAFVHLTQRCKEENCKKHDVIPNRYHFNRWKVARDSGYELISIFDWMDKRYIEEFLRFKLGKISKHVGARKCIAREVNRNEAKEFIDNHHLLGFPHVKNITNFGLYFEDELISILSVCRPRYKNDSKYDYELLRYVSSINVSGGLNKLWKLFLETCNPTSVITYTDNNFGNGFIYKSIGFTELSIEKPSAIWENLKFPRYKFHSKILAHQGADVVIKNYAKLMGRDYFTVGMNFEDYKLRGGREFYNRPNDTEDNWIRNEDIARFYGFVKIFDCGNTRWCWYK